MAQIGDKTHTPHGLGTITEIDSVRGRTQYRVAGAGFNVWLDETKVHVANEGGLFSYAPIRDYAERARNTPQYSIGYDPSEEEDPRIEHFGGLDATIEPGSTPVNERNHTTLPYDYTPQYHHDVWADEQTIQPGEQEIDAEDRLRSTDSVSGERRDERPYPGPNPDLFAKSSSVHQGGPFGVQFYPGTMDDYFDHLEDERATERELQRKRDEDDKAEGKWPRDSKGRPPGHQNYKMEERAKLGYYDEDYDDEYSESGNRPGHGTDDFYSYNDRGEDAYREDAEAHDGIDFRDLPEGPIGRSDYEELPRRWKEPQSHDDLWAAGYSPDGQDKIDRAKLKNHESGELSPGESWGHLAYRPAGLSDRYAYFEVEADNHDSPVAQFRRDPVGYIEMCGHLWTDGDDSLEKFADYTGLIDIDPTMREAAWSDVRQKAQRLRREGRVHVNDMGENRIYATVEGDHGTYDTMIAKGGSMGGFGGGQSITNWACSCDWGRWAFKRQMTYVGRLCSHGYATYLTMQSDYTKANPIQQSQPYKKKWAAAHEEAHDDYPAHKSLTALGQDPVEEFLTWCDHNGSSPDDPASAHAFANAANLDDADYDAVVQSIGKYSSRTAGIVEDYKSWLEENDQNPEAASVASFLAYSGDDDPEDAEKLYDYISGNHDEAPERDYDTDYVTQPEDAYKTAYGPSDYHSNDNTWDRHDPPDPHAQRCKTCGGQGGLHAPDCPNEKWSPHYADLLRTTPRSLTPDLRAVPEGEGEQWVDVTKDDRKTTGPDQIVKDSALAEATLRYLHGAGAFSQGITDFVEGSPGGFSPAAPNPAKDPYAAQPDPNAGSKSGPKTGSRRFAESSDASLLDKLRELSTAPANDGLGHKDTHNEELRDVVDELQDRGYDASFMVAAVSDDEENASDGKGDFLGRSVADWATEPFAGSGPAPKNWFSDSAGYVDENERDRFVDVTDAPDGDIIKFNDDRSKPQQGPRTSSRYAADYSDYPGVPLSQLPLPGLSPYGDDPVAIAFDEHGEPIDQALNSDTARTLAQEGYDVQATGDDVWHNELGEHRIPQQQIQDSADYEKRIRHDLLHGDYGNQGGPRRHWDGDKQARRYADNFNEMSGTLDPQPLPSGMPGLESSPTGGETADFDNSQVMAALHYADATGFFNPNAPGADDWENASGKPFLNEVQKASDEVSKDLGGDGDNSDSGDGEDSGDGQDDSGGGGGGASMLPGLLKGLTGGGGEAAGGAALGEAGAAGAAGAGAGAAAGGAEAAGLMVLLHKREVKPSMSAAEYWRQAEGGGVRRAGRGATSQVRVDPGTRQPGRPKQAMNPPDDFGFEGEPTMDRYAAAENDGDDIVAAFQRSAGAAAVMGNGGGSGANDDIADRALAFLRTAGRKYTPAEQRELEAEHHPLGARNLPTEDELQGTHYVLGM